jgi:uncharacterized NAD-dependent epimerase/dehydratase family protein
MSYPEKYVLYIGDANDILDIKTANGFCFWRKEDCVGEIALPGCTVTTGLPKMSIAEAKKHGATRFVMGITTHGGRLGHADIPAVQEALALGYLVISGLHLKLGDIDAIRNHPAYRADRVAELRHNAENVIATGTKRKGRRLLTVGTDCCVGKMYTTLALEKELKKRGVACTFRATGQTGMMIAGGGVCVDAVVSDFAAGSVERLCPENDPEHWDLIEGQGSLYHPAYAGVSLSLLHGAQPDAIVVCHEWGRKIMDGTRDFHVPSLREAIDLNLLCARMVNPSAKVVAISMNTRHVADLATARRICDETEEELGLPCMDVVRHGVSAMISGIF